MPTGAPLQELDESDGVGNFQDAGETDVWAIEARRALPKDLSAPETRQLDERHFCCLWRDLFPQPSLVNLFAVDPACLIGLQGHSPQKHVVFTRQATLLMAADPAYRPRPDGKAKAFSLCE